MLIGHLAELDFVAVRGALLDVDFQDLALLLRPEALAVATAGAALRLHLLDHGTHSHDLDLHTAALAGSALLHAASLVDDLAGDSHLLSGSVVHLFEGNLEGLDDVLGLLAPPATSASASAAEHLAEDVAAVHAAAFFEALLAEAVVLRSLLGVAEDLVGSSDLLELLGITALVGVVLHGQLSVGLLDFGVIGLLIDLEQLVELVVVDVFAASAATTAAGEVTAGHAGKAATEEHLC
mmetsp:Transcript_68424/g.149409  ORF Transcript_68424/g.149409 Transcript_68424/m.149409 type:complete len:237 (-) Transcript_68424:69-779(-)